MAVHLLNISSGTVQLTHGSNCFQIKELHFNYGELWYTVVRKSNEAYNINETQKLNQVEIKGILVCKSQQLGAV